MYRRNDDRFWPPGRHAGPLCAIGTSGFGLKGWGDRPAAVFGQMAPAFLRASKMA